MKASHRQQVIQRLDRLVSNLEEIKERKLLVESEWKNIDEDINQTYNFFLNILNHYIEGIKYLSMLIPNVKSIYWRTVHGMMTMKWIDIREIDNPGRKTKAFVVYGKDDDPETLGYIRWYGAWRKYCFSPYNDTVFEWCCLRDIAGFCEEETKRYRESNR